MPEEITDLVTNQDQPEKPVEHTEHGLETLTPEQREQAIKLYDQIRNEPYRVVLDETRTDFCNFPDCVGKAMRLHALLAEIGIETYYGICDYRWSDCDLPLDVLQVPHEDRGGHMFLLYKFLNPDTNKLEWRVLDPTWHPGIRTSFPSSNWDGVHGTPVAVVPTSLMERVDPNNTDAMQDLDLFNLDLYFEDLKKNGEFYKALNKHFEYLEQESAKRGDDLHHPTERPGYPF